jgi:tetratricopeptide (TPR) repeat protein
MKKCSGIFLFLLTTTFGAVQAENNLCTNEYKKLRKLHTSALSEYSSSPEKGRASLQILEEKINNSLTQCSNHALLLSLMAETQISLGNNMLAIAYGKKAVTYDQNTWETNFAYGTALTLTGDYENGLVYLERASKLYPENIYLKFNLCSNYEMAKLYKKAIQTCTSVLDQGDKEVIGDIYYIRGRAYKALGKSEKAEEDFRKAKELGVDGTKYYSKGHLEGGKIE